MYGFDNLTLDPVEFTVQGSRSAESDYFVVTLFIAAVVLLTERLIEAYFSSVSYKLLIIIVTVAYYVVQHILMADKSKKSVPKKMTGGRSLAIIMPLILLKITKSLDMYVFRRCFFQIVILSTVGMALFSLMVGYASYSFEDPSRSVLWVHMLAYAISFSGTDDVEISKSYLEYEAIRDALVILDGEFLITSAFCIFGLNVSAGIFDGSVSKWYQVMFLLIRYFGLGVVVGFPFGWLIAFILPRILDDIPSFTISLLVFAYLVYFFCEFILNCSGTIATFIACTFTISIRRRLASETDTVLKIILDVIYSLFMYTRFIMSAYIEIYYMFMYISTFKFVQWVAMFFILFIGRILVLVILYPVFKYTGARLQLNSMMVLFWLSKKGIIQLLSVETLYTNRLVYDTVYSIGGYILISITLGLIFQSMFTKTFLKSFHLTEVASSNKHNLSKCINLINTRSLLLIDVSKTYRLFSEIKWSKINDLTTLYNPYLSLLNLKVKRQMRTFCEECKQEVYITQIKRDFLLLAREARLMVLKAYKVCIQRMFWKNLIEEETFKYMLTKVENLMLSEELFFLDKNLEQNLEKRTLLDAFKEFLINIGKEDIVLKPPRKKFRRICYKIISMKSYEIIIYFFCVAYLFLYYYTIFKTETEADETARDITEILFASLFILDLVLKIMGYSHISAKKGFSLYMSNKWNLLDFISLASNVFIVFVNAFIHYDLLTMDRGYVLFSFLFFMRQVSLLRILRTIVVIYKLRQWFIKICNKMLFKRKSFCYDIVKTLLMCHDDIIHRLPAMEILPDIYDHLMQILEAERDRIQEMSCHMNIMLPDVISIHHTNMIFHSTMHFLMESVTYLKIKGLLEDEEKDKLVEECVIKKIIKIKDSGSLSARDIFENINWLQEAEILNMAIKTAGKVTWKENDVVVKAGQVTSGVIILTEGVLMSDYKPTTESLEQLKNYGILPISDCYDYKICSSEVQKCLTPGSSIGLLAILTGRKNDASVVARVEGKGFYIPQHFFLENINKYSDPINGFYSTLWKNVSFDIVYPLLWESENYRNKTQQEFYTYLHRSFVPYLCDRRTFAVKDLVKDIVLIEGLVKDMVSTLIYTGPVYIPRGVSCLGLLRENGMVEPKLWIVPTRNANIPSILKYDDDHQS